MKKIITCALIFSLLALTTSFSTEEQAIENLLLYAAAAIDSLQQAGYYVEVPENAGQVFYMEKGQYIQLDGTFYSGTNYVIVASGDSNATDVDIEVYDAGWNLIFDGNTNGINSDVILTPNYTTELHVMVKLTATKAGTSTAHVGFLVFYVS